jgi:hypothetical protein
MWTQYAIVVGWVQVCTILKDISRRQCNSAPLLSRSGHCTSQMIQYRYECAFGNRISCGWQLRILVPFDQVSAVEQYCRTHPEDAACTQDVPRLCFDRQSMPTAKLDERATAHAHHVCIVQLSGTHSPHTTYQKHSAHCLFQAHCALHPDAQHYKKQQIRSWLLESKIDCVHVGYNAEGKQVRTCQLEVMVKRCKRFCEARRRRAESDKEASDVEGSEDEGSEDESELVGEESKSEGEEEGSAEEEEGSEPGAFSRQQGAQPPRKQHFLQQQPSANMPVRTHMRKQII